ncbi:hypothetical protein SAY86_016220 [Trapa natans]|uniref:RNA polymerase II subunit B1 CTD phosphatase RPAP2 homolog n=1 Tax=Trapa natans TaxID=22666 RepID=A0AAN7R185_TRANT|nr:hypothetical protein SAY86_016220 [Trapa natans]
MAKRADEPLSVKDAVYKLQMFLLDGISSEAQLLAASSIMSRGDYEDVVTERTIEKLCGYPLCSKSLPTDRPHNGRYRISLKEHKVFDLTETYKYCSSECLINSRVFAGSLLEERCSVLNLGKLREVLRLFNGLSLELEEGGDFGISMLNIHEKEVKSGEMPEQWAGPSNAVEGYVPRKERKPTPSPSKAHKEGCKPTNVKPANTHLIINDFDFVSSIITEDEYSVSKLPLSLTKTTADSKLKEWKEGSKVVSSDQLIHKINNQKSEDKSIYSADIPSSSNTWQDGSVKPVNELGETSNVEEIDGKVHENRVKSSLKSKGTNKVRTVTWADENKVESRNGNLCDVREIECSKKSGDARFEDDYTWLSFLSAEICALTLNPTAEVDAFDISDEKEMDSKNENLCDIREIEDIEGSEKPGDARFEEEDTLLSFLSAEVCVMTLNPTVEADAFYISDEKEMDLKHKNLCDVREIEDIEGSEKLGDGRFEDDVTFLPFLSAEACAMTLNPAVEADAFYISDENEMDSKNENIEKPDALLSSLSAETCAMTLDPTSEADASYISDEKEMDSKNENLSDIREIEAIEGSEKSDDASFEDENTLLPFLLAESCAVTLDPTSEVDASYISDKREMDSKNDNFCDVREIEVIEGLEKPDYARFEDEDTLLSFLSDGACVMTLKLTVEDDAFYITDEKEMDSRNGNICDVREIDDIECLEKPCDAPFEDEDTLLPFLSAEACAMTLKPTAEDDASENYDVFDTDEDEEYSEEYYGLEYWLDDPPEGWSLTLSPFGTMWGALLSWITSSSLAYIYGQDDSFQEDYVSVTWRGYPQKMVLADGRSSQIKQTLAGCLVRALPGLILDMRISVPRSTLEQGLGGLLSTMSFTKPLPSYQPKQWKVVALLFLDALSISRIPSLIPFMTNRPELLEKVIVGADMDINMDHFKVMQDHLIPLGRAPRFSAQSGA